MALVLKDRVKETSTTTGTGTFTLAGAATGFQSFSVIGNSNTVYYAIVLNGANEWEIGIGTYTSSGTTLSRDTVLESSNSGSKVNFSAGAKEVFCTYPAEKAVTLDDVQTLSNKTLSNPSVTGKITFADGSTVASGWSGFKNRIINGAMGIWQRGTSFTVSTTTVTYTADRFGIYQPSGTGTITRDTDAPTGFKYSLKVVGAGTDVIQRIESVNTTDLVGESVTVSVRFKQTVGAGSGSMTVALQHPNAADNFSALTAISSQTFTPTSSWATYTLTFANLPSGVANGMSIDIYPTSSASSATYFITGVQLEKGSTATSFDYRPYGTELALCQRYYQLVRAGWGAAQGSTVVGLSPQLVCEMRSNPAIGQTGTLYVSDGANDSVQSSTGITTYANYTNLIIIGLNNYTGLVTNRPYFLRGNTSTALTISAEL